MDNDGGIYENMPFFANRGSRCHHPFCFVKLDTFRGVFPYTV